MIQLQDQALSQSNHENLFKIVNGRAFKRTEKFNPEQPNNEKTLVYKFEHPEKEFILTTLLPVIKLPANLQVSKVYAKAVNFGDNPRLHTNSKKEDSKTLIYYPNLVWKPMWGAETLFENPNYGHESGLYDAVAPVPNRLIVFSGSVPYVERPPLYQHLTVYSIIIEMEPINYSEKEKETLITYPE